MEPGDFNHLNPAPAGAVLVGDYAARWLDALPSRLRPKTVKSYRELYRLHLAPSFKGVGLCELKRVQVKTLLLDKQRQGLSRNTVRLIGSCLSALCSEAIDDGLLTVSPVTALGRWLRGPAEQCDAVGRARTIRPLTTGEVACILATARKFYPRYYPLFLTLARTGCRPGEALALRWSEVNFTRREILIERALSAGRIGPTKTGRSRRVDMSRELLGVLGRLRKQREAHARRNHSKALPQWVFLSRKGELINEDWPRRVFAKVLKRAGLPWHTPYDLRHTFATLHLAKGHPITYVSAQLGHSDPSTTLRWYAHWLPTSDKRFADALDTPGQRRRAKS